MGLNYIRGLAAPGGRRFSTLSEPTPYPETKPNEPKRVKANRIIEMSQKWPKANPRACFRVFSVTYKPKRAFLSKSDVVARSGSRIQPMLDLAVRAESMRAMRALP